MHVYVCLHTRTSVCVCVLGPCPGEEKVRILVPHPPRLLFPPSVPCAPCPPHPPPGWPAEEGNLSPRRGGLTGSATLWNSTLIAPESPWSTSAAGLLATQTTAPWPRSAQDQEREALGNPSSSGLPLPSLRRGQRTEEGGQRTEDGGQRTEATAKEGRGSAGQKECGGRGAGLNYAEGSQVLSCAGGR